MLKKKAMESHLLAALSPNFEDLWDSGVCNSLQWISICPQEEQCWHDFPKKQANFFFGALHDPLSFRGWDSSGNSHTAGCTLVSRSYQKIQVLSPVSTCLVNFEQPSWNFRNINMHHSAWSHHCSSQWDRDPSFTLVSDMKIIMQYGHGHCWLLLNILESLK